VIFRKNSHVKIRCSQQRITSIVSVHNKINKAVNNYGKQTPPENSGFESFEFWTPERRPAGNIIAMDIQPALTGFSAENIINGYVRPYITSNAWVADLKDQNPTLSLVWDAEKTIRDITLFLDPDYDHPMENVNWDHKEYVVPFMLRNYKIVDDNENVVFEIKDNYQAINRIRFEKPVITKSLKVVCEHPSTQVPASIFQLIVT